MKQSSNNKLKQKSFIKQAVLRSPHHIALVVANMGRLSMFKSWLNSYAKRNYIGDSRLKQYNTKDVTNYKLITQDTSYWHGTGRYQNQNSNIVDIFSNICKTGSLIPTNDIYSIFINGRSMTSLSATTLRIIARCYADTHGKGASEPNRYGNSMMWVAYYYGLFYIKLMIFRPYKTFNNWKHWEQQAYDGSGDVSWGKKSNLKAKAVWDVFNIGSNIPANYPIIFGINGGAKPIKLPKLFHKYETRFDKNITFEYITHVEVPENKVADTKNLLKKYGIKTNVLPIELGEFYASGQNFSHLVGL